MNVLLKTIWMAACLILCLSIPSVATAVVAISPDTLVTNEDGTVTVNQALINERNRQAREEYNAWLASPAGKRAILKGKVSSLYASYLHNVVGRPVYWVIGISIFLVPLVWLIWHMLRRHAHEQSRLIRSLLRFGAVKRV